jgi:predicted dehydrogenase
LADTQEVTQIAVIGAGAFGRNHVRVLKEIDGSPLAGVYDADPARAAVLAHEFGTRAFTNLDEVADHARGAVVAVPTIVHAEVGVKLMEAGVDVLIEKPISPDLDSAEVLVTTAAKLGRILQVGHLERFNPAVELLERTVKLPLFFEIHRMSVFTPRSLDVDVVLDLMIHDIEILLALTKTEPVDIKAAGIHVLSAKSDIANVRMEFPGGVVANLTASRASTERVRKLRVFEPGAYHSLDYAKQELFTIRISPQKKVALQPHAVSKGEPLRKELEAFRHSIETREKPKVDGETSLRALRVALDVVDKIEVHAGVVKDTLRAAGIEG